MLYLIDASTLITAQNTYYAINRVPEFWAWLLHHGAAGAVKIPSEIYAEVEDGNDPLADWMAEQETKDALRFAEEADVGAVQVVTALYGDNLTDAEIELIGKDPFLISAAFLDAANRCVVTSEVSKPAAQRANRKIPDLCADLNVTALTPVQFLNVLNFSTSWDA